MQLVRESANFFTCDYLPGYLNQCRESGPGSGKRHTHNKSAHRRGKNERDAFIRSPFLSVRFASPICSEIYARFSFVPIFFAALPLPWQWAPSASIFLSILSQVKFIFFKHFLFNCFVFIQFDSVIVFLGTLFVISFCSFYGHFPKTRS